MSGPDLIFIRSHRFGPVEAALAALAPEVERVSGEDRYAVSAAMAREIGASETAYVSVGTNWPDGLAGGALGGHAGAVMVILS